MEYSIMKYSIAIMYHNYNVSQLLMLLDLYFLGEGGMLYWVSHYISPITSPFALTTLGYTASYYSAIDSCPHHSRIQIVELNKT